MTTADRLLLWLSVFSLFGAQSGFVVARLIQTRDMGRGHQIGLVIALAVGLMGMTLAGSMIFYALFPPMND